MFRPLFVGRPPAFHIFDRTYSIYWPVCLSLLGETVTKKMTSKEKTMTAELFVNDSRFFFLHSILWPDDKQEDHLTTIPASHQSLPKGLLGVMRHDGVFDDLYY